MLFRSFSSVFYVFFIGFSYVNVLVVFHHFFIGFPSSSGRRCWCRSPGERPAPCRRRPRRPRSPQCCRSARVARRRPGRRPAKKRHFKAMSRRFGPFHDLFIAFSVLLRAFMARSRASIGLKDLISIGLVVVEQHVARQEPGESPGGAR